VFAQKSVNLQILLPRHLDKLRVTNNQYSYVVVTDSCFRAKSQIPAEIMMLQRRNYDMTTTPLTRHVFKDGEIKSRRQ